MVDVFTPDDGGLQLLALDRHRCQLSDKSALWFGEAIGAAKIIGEGHA